MHVGVALGVFGFPGSMDATVKFDHEFALMTVEVSDVIPDLMLATELEIK